MKKILLDPNKRPKHSSKHLKFSIIIIIIILLLMEKGKGIFKINIINTYSQKREKNEK